MRAVSACTRLTVVRRVSAELGQPGMVLSGVPDGPMGERMKALSFIIASSDTEEELTDWLKTDLGPGSSRITL